MKIEPTSYAPITEWASLVPELMCSNLEHSLDVYIRLFGFTLNYTRQGFAYLSKGRVQWMLEQYHDHKDWLTGQLEYPFGRGINFQIAVDDLDQIYIRLEADHYPMRVPMKTVIYKEGDKEHIQRQFLVLDPDGYLLRFIDSGN